MATKCPRCDTDNPETVKFCGECGSSLSQAKDASFPLTETLEITTDELVPGSPFAGRYQIIEELGRGGMGRVYRAVDARLHEQVAIKLIRPEIAADKRTLERFQNELKLARKIAHRNVGKMYELMEDEGTYFITMEYIPGEDLRKFIRRSGQLAVGTTVRIAREICGGLAEAHRLGVVHRDLKPSNVIIDNEGHARIMDFGIARSLESRGITGVGMIIGTPEYMSPEQAEGGKVDQRSDIYSLGVIIYEMATGKLPFEGGTPLGVALKHKTEIPPDPRRINPQIPAELSRLILRCLEKDQSSRYESAGDVLAGLDGIEESLTAEQAAVRRRGDFVKSLRKLVKKRKIIVAASVVAILAIVGWGLWQVIQGPGISPLTPAKHSLAVLPFVDLSPGKKYEHIAEGIPEQLINSLGRIKDLWVSARTSSFYFKGIELDVREIGQKLNVESVLEGSIQVDGDNLRVTVNLTSTKDGFQIWSDRYDKKMMDLFSIQDEIGREVIKFLKVKLLGEEKVQLAKKPTENQDAYGLYLQGRYFWQKRTEVNLLRSVDFFRKAFQEDPNFALAYAGLADAYALLGDNGYLPDDEAYPQAKQAALKALELDDSLAEAHAALAAILSDYERDWIGAEREYRLAIEVNPDYAEAHHWYAFLLTYLGRHEEAIGEVWLARDLDPLAPRIATNIGALLFYARKYDQAFEELKKVEGLFPEHRAVYYYLVDVFTAMGRFEDALSYCRKIEEMTGREPDWLVARIFAKSGRKKDAQELLAKMKAASESGYEDLTEFAVIHGLLGEADQAFLFLDKAYAQRESSLCYLRVKPCFDPLRSDPRFKDMLKRMNLD